jgi:KipI family sensor histidine kinase inhibitor
VSDFGLREAGESGLLLELDNVIDPRVNARAIAMAAAVEDARIPGVRDVVPAYRSVGVHFDPLVTDVGRLESLLRRRGDSSVPDLQGRTIQVPVVYGGDAGPDLPEVAAFAGLTEAQVIHLHAGPAYRVFMLGFLPGFPYLGLVDPRIAAPRRASPRLRVRAGSVGIAGLQTGIYPRDSPGGWQIVGRTPLALFDAGRTPPALMTPGDTVRFVPAAESDSGSASKGPTARVASGVTSHSRRAEGRHLTVLSPGLLTTIQDTGRWGHQAIGVPVSGPLDPFSHRLANALVGNDRRAAALEITLHGPELRFEADACVAVTGADLEPTLDGRPLPMNQPVAGRAGSVLRFGERRHGARSYLAVDGGVVVPHVLGSRATHVLSGLGGVDGRTLRAGDVLPLGPPGIAPRPRRTTPQVVVPASKPARLRVLAGPHHDVWSSSALETLTGSRFTVSTDSNRMGYRLEGASVAGELHAALISTPTFTGAIQVPPSGEPVLLMADRQTTGGYAQVATVIAADLPVAGQLAPGDRVEFQICSRRDALAALVDQERALLALE